MILIIEDEMKTAAYLKKGFSEYGIDADVCHDGNSGLGRAVNGNYTIIILDVMIPERDGWSVLSELRRLKVDTPVIMLSGLDSVPHRVKGLTLGADDYLVKPFAFSELYARVLAISRRNPTQKLGLIRIGDLEVFIEEHRATRGGQRLDLTPKELALLILLMRHSGQVVSKTRIGEKIWNMTETENSHLIEVHMRRLRAKVDDPFERKLIHTVRGVGYVLEERD